MKQQNNCADSTKAPAQRPVRPSCVWSRFPKTILYLGRLPVAVAMVDEIRKMYGPKVKIVESVTPHVAKTLNSGIMEPLHEAASVLAITSCMVIKFAQRK